MMEADFGENDRGKHNELIFKKMGEGLGRKEALKQPSTLNTTYVV